MTDLGWPTLQHRRSNAKLVMVYRITHNLMPIPSCTVLPPHDTWLPWIRTRPILQKFSFIPSAIRLWNQLPEHIATTVSLDAFKGGLVMGS